MSDEKKPEGSNVTTRRQTLREYLPRLVRWLSRGLIGLWPVLLGAALMVVIYKMIASSLQISGCREQDVRWLGAFLQLAGFGTVAWGLMNAERHFQRPTIRGRIRDYFARFPPRVVKIISASGHATASSSASVRFISLPGDATPIEEQLRRIKENIKDLHREVGEISEELKRKVTQIDSRIDENFGKFKDENAQIRIQLEEAFVGGIHVEWWGLMMFALGIFLASLSPEIALWVGHLPSCY